MLNNITYKNKGQLLLIAFLLLGLVIYFSSISKTISLYSECNSLEARINASNNIKDRINSLEQESTRVDILLGGIKADSEAMLLEAISESCREKGIVLKEFPLPIYSKEQEVNIITFTVVMEGDFKQLVNFLYDAEKNFKGGRIASSVFFLTTDTRSKREFLNLKIIIQSISNG